MGLANYLQPVPYDQLNAPHDPQGRLVTPIIPPMQSHTSQDLLQKLADLLLALPDRAARAFEQRFQWAARDAQFWYQQSVLTNVAAGATSRIAAWTVPERFNARLMYIGVDSNAALSDVFWTLRINGSVHPGFNLIAFNTGNLSTPLQFQQEISAGKTVELFAKNGNAAGVSVIGMIGGFQKQMLDLDTIAITPTNGLG